MKQILAKIFGGAGGSVAEQISGIIAKHTSSKEEKARFEKEMTEVFINAESDMQKNITERWLADSQSDSWLSKNVRPLVLIFIDAGVIQFEGKANWGDLVQLVVITVISAYFGGRRMEKIRKK